VRRDATHRRHRAFLAVAAGLLLLGVVGPLSVGELLTRPAPRPVGAPPADLDALPVAIPARDGTAIQSWLTHGPPDAPVVLLLHSIRSDRTEMLGRARFLRALGYRTLLLDLPAHGETPGERITFGLKESAGVASALDYLRERFPGARVGAIGVSLGGAALALVEPAPALDAIVLEAVYPDLDSAARNRLGLHLGAWAEPLAPLLLAQVRWRLGVAPERLRPVDRIGAIAAPKMVVSGALDRHTTPRDTERLHAAAREPTALWIVKGAGHEDLHRFAPAEYEARIGAFFARYLQPAQ
jgi:pimeloyl-ACP methyl ester carboxylesterase